MSIGKLNSAYTYNILNQNYSTKVSHRNYDVRESSVSAEITTYSKSNSNQKDYGTLFGNYLKESGYFEGMSEVDIEAITNELKSKVYSADKSKINNAYSSYTKVIDSTYYLRSLAYKLDNHEKKSELLSLIESYNSNMKAVVSDYLSELKDEKLKAQEQKKVDDLRNLEMQTEQLNEQLEQAEEQAEAMEESMNALSACFNIAMRIAKGEKVPSEDEQYLMENQPDLYKMAMLMKATAEKSDKVNESAIPEEKEKEESSEEVDTEINIEEMIA